MDKFTIGPVPDAAWDAYVGQHPAGHHEQSSSFARNRESYRFRTARIGVSEKGHLVGGAQFIYRWVPFAGRFGTVPQGPLVDQHRTDVAEALIHALRTQARELRIRRLRVVSYAEDDFWRPLLTHHGFAAGGYRWTTRETALLRLDRSNEDMLAAMKPKCRYWIRLAQRKGVRIVPGQEADLDEFYVLKRSTANRQGFVTFPTQYFKDTWRTFSPHNKIKLFLAHYDGEPVAGILVTVIGNCAYYGWGGLSKQKQDVGANYLAHWEAIQWARSVGCASYDFAGLDGDDGVSRFKRQWGGDIVDYPDPLDGYFGPLAKILEKACKASWDDARLRDLLGKLNYRLYGPMPH